MPPTNNSANGFREITKELLRQIEILAMIHEKDAYYSENDLCEYFGGISPATLRRDLSAIRSFGVSVHTERGVVCFSHNIKEKEQKKNYLILLNQLISLYIAINEKETIRNLRGIFKKFKNRTLNMFVKIIKSINSKKIIRLEYSSNSEGATKFYEITPIGFNRTQHSFHLIGLNNDEIDSIKFFLFERIKDISFTQKNSSHKQVPNMRDIYKYSWANFTGGDIQEVELKFENQLSDYFKEKIFLEEQNVDERSDGIYVKFKVALSYEFVSWILGWGSKVKVLKPKSLKEKVIRRAEEIIANY